MRPAGAVDSTRAVVWLAMVLAIRVSAFEGHQNGVTTPTYPQLTQPW